MLVADSGDSAEEEPPLATETRRRCDAIVLCSPRMTDAVLAGLAESLRPLVLVNRSGRDVGAPSVAIDYRSGVLDLARHLHALGHREVAYLDGPQASASTRDRLLGLADAEATLPGLRVRRMAGGASAEDGLAAAAEVRASGVSAVMAFNDLGAVGLVHGLRGLGVHVPGDLSVVGFDDIPFARFLVPALTTASAPYELMGKEAWLRMRSLLRGEPPEQDGLLGPRLHVRGSTGPR